MNDLIKKLLKFGVVGTSGFVIDFSITWLLYEQFAISIYIATGFGFTFGACSNYFLNRRWTWRSTDPNIKREFLKFYTVSAIGLGIHYIVLTMCTMLLPWFEFSLFGVGINNDWTSKLVATGVVMIWNFLVNNFYTFKKQ